MSKEKELSLFRRILKGVGLVPIKLLKGIAVLVFLLIIANTSFILFIKNKIVTSGTRLKSQA
jgi:hypothetical protein